MLKLIPIVTLAFANDAFARGANDVGGTGGGGVIVALLIGGFFFYLWLSDKLDKRRERNIEPSPRCGSCNNWSPQQKANKVQLGPLCRRCKERTFLGSP